MTELTIDKNAIEDLEPVISPEEIRRQLEERVKALEEDLSSATDLREHIQSPIKIKADASAEERVTAANQTIDLYDEVLGPEFLAEQALNAPEPLDFERAGENNPRIWTRLYQLKPEIAFSLNFGVDSQGYPVECSPLLIGGRGTISQLVKKAREAQRQPA